MSVDLQDTLLSQDLVFREVDNNRTGYPDMQHVPTITDALKQWFKTRTLFVVFFIIPVTLAAVYYLFIACDMYVSEARFIVRSSSIAPMLGVAGGNTGQVASLVRTTEDTQSVNAYLCSRDAMERLISDNNFLQIVNRPEADFLSRFPHFATRAGHEALFSRLPEYIDPLFDAATGVSTLRVWAFRPEDARGIALALLSDAEELINRLNSRARNDAIAFAEDVVARSEAKVMEAQASITAFRNRETVFDPARQAAATLELIAKLTSEIAELKATLGEISTNSPDSPRVEAVRNRIPRACRSSVRTARRHRRERQFACAQACRVRKAHAGARTRRKVRGLSPRIAGKRAAGGPPQTALSRKDRQA